ncbi:MAG TPA: fumarylacetoacetate hydrolase family protein [Solirubrobacterales bacterium]|nr:fumarylacetoacetate hydrolase family protein [Solirubrobacterales bacterium]
MDGGVLDLSRSWEALLELRGEDAGSAGTTVPGDMVGFLEAGTPALEAAHELVALAGAGELPAAGGPPLVVVDDEFRLAAPLPRPNSLRDFMVVEEHVLNSLQEVPDEWFNLPVYYTGNVEEIYGPDDVVPWPAYTDKLDYELELCAVIGKAGRRIPVERAAEHIAGYTLYNDWSARDIQLREMSVGIGPAMGKHFASSIGPCIATDIDRDEIVLSARVDGEEWSRGTIGEMHFSFEEIIAWVSQEQTLYPGDLLGSGTMGGGCGLELDRWIEPGSSVELSGTRIGVLANRVGEKGKGSRRATEPRRRI